MTSVTKTQSDCAFYNDGSESGSTLISGTNIVVGNTGAEDKGFDTTILFRAVVQVAGKNDTDGYRLEVQKNGAGGYDILGNITGITAVDSTNLTAGNDTTQRLGSGTFVSPNGGVGDNGDVGSLTIPAGEETEFLWAFEIDQADVSDVDYFDFRVHEDGGGALDTYSETLRVTVDKTITYTGELFVVDFEENDLSDFDSYGGTPDVGASYALGGSSYGMRVYADGIGTDEDGVVSLSSHDTDRLRFRLYLDPNTIGMSTGNNMQIVRIQDSASGNVFVLYLAWDGSSYELDFDYIDDSSTNSPASPVNISDAEHYVEFFIQRESADGEADGTLDWWIDGSAQTQLTGIDDFINFNDMAEFGLGNINVSGVYTGYVYLDELVVRDDNTEIGATGPTYTQSVAGALSFSGAVSKKGKKPVAGALSFSGDITKKTSKPLAGALSFAGNVYKKMFVALGGDLSFSGVVSGIKKVFITLTGSLGFSGDLTKKTGKPLGGSLSFSGDITKKTSISLAGALSFAGDVAKKTKKVLAGAVDFVGALVTNYIPGGGTTFYQSVAGALSFSGDVTKKAKKPLAGVISFDGDVTKKTSKTFAGALSFAGTVTKKMFVSLAGSLSFVGTMTKLPKKLLVGVISFSGTATKKTKKPLVGSLSFGGTISKKTKKVLAGAIDFAGSVTGLNLSDLIARILRAKRRKMRLTTAARDVSLTAVRRDLLLTAAARDVSLTARKRNLLLTAEIKNG